MTLELVETTSPEIIIHTIATQAAMQGGQEHVYASVIYTIASSEVARLLPINPHIHVVETVLALQKALADTQTHAILIPAHAAITLAILRRQLTLNGMRKVVFREK